MLIQIVLGSNLYKNAEKKQFCRIKKGLKSPDQKIPYTTIVNKNQQIIMIRRLNSLFIASFEIILMHAQSVDIILFHYENMKNIGNDVQNIPVHYRTTLLLLNIKW